MPGTALGTLGRSWAGGQPRIPAAKWRLWEASPWVFSWSGNCLCSWESEGLHPLASCGLGTLRFLFLTCHEQHPLCLLGALSTVKCHERGWCCHPMTWLFSQAQQCQPATVLLPPLSSSPQGEMCPKRATPGPRLGWGLWVPGGGFYVWSLMWRLDDQARILLCGARMVPETVTSLWTLPGGHPPTETCWFGAASCGEKQPRGEGEQWACLVKSRVRWGTALCDLGSTQEPCQCLGTELASTLAGMQGSGMCGKGVVSATVWSSPHLLLSSCATLFFAPCSLAHNGYASSGLRAFAHADLCPEIWNVQICRKLQHVIKQINWITVSELMLIFWHFCFRTLFNGNKTTYHYFYLLNHFELYSSVVYLPYWTIDQLLELFHLIKLKRCSH